MNFRWVSSPKDREAAFRIRRETFVAEQGIPEEFAFDARDERATHLLALSEDGEPAGSGRMLESEKDSGVAQISGVCVRKEFRRRGLAARMMGLLEHRAKLSGFRAIETAAPVDVRPFYRKNGYQELGPAYQEYGIRHQRMTKQLAKRVVVAVGGNAVVDGYDSVLTTARAIVSLRESGWEVVLTHGNGPQVGAALLRNEAAREKVKPHSLSMCVAETQGTLGYEFCRALNETLESQGREPLAVAIVTQTEVDPEDEAFENPRKPIGSFMSKEEAEKRAREDGWRVMDDAGRGWRRIVPSPKPSRIVQAPAVRSLLKAGYLAVASGGGGIPTDATGAGLDAVIDKDRTAALLAREVEADALLIATAVPNAYLNFGTSDQVTLGRVSLTEMRSYLQGDHFSRGSMRPKVEACIDFLSFTAKTAIITDIDNLASGLKLEAGTCIDPYF